MSQRRFQPRLLIVLSLAVGLLGACGGGGGGSAANAPATLSSGTISGLGSIIVNGVRYETVGSQVLDADDDSTVINTPLRLGMTVSVAQSGTDAESQRPVAGKIWVQSGIKGIAYFTSAGLTVAGMPVTTDATTLVRDATGAVTSLTTLNTQSVEAYGLPQADGSFLATLVEVETGALGVQVVGAVQSINTTTKTLVLGTASASVTVDYANITPPSGLATGAVVVVKSPTSASASTYIASSLRIRSATASTYESYARNYSGTTRLRNERNELFGIVSDKVLTASGATVTGCTFKIQGIQVQASSSTLCANLSLGTYVEVKGVLNNGVLSATNVAFESTQSNGYSDDLNDADSDGLRHRSLSALSTATERTSARSFELYGSLSCTAVNVGCTLTRGAVTYTADMSSAYWNEGAPIANGFVEAKGYLTSNTFKVGKIESKDRRFGTGRGDDD